MLRVRLILTSQEKFRILLDMCTRVYHYARQIIFNDVSPTLKPDLQEPLHIICNTNKFVICVNGLLRCVHIQSDNRLHAFFLLEQIKQNVY